MFLILATISPSHLRLLCPLWPLPLEQQLLAIALQTMSGHLWPGSPYTPLLYQFSGIRGAKRAISISNVPFCMNKEQLPLCIPDCKHHCKEKKRKLQRAFHELWNPLCIPWVTVVQVLGRLGAPLPSSITNTTAAHPFPCCFANCLAFWGITDLHITLSSVPEGFSISVTVKPVLLCVIPQKRKYSCTRHKI